MSLVSKNILFSLVGQALVVVLGLFAGKFLFAELGEEVLGLVYFSWSLSTIMAGALDLGVSTTIVREVSRTWQRDNAYARGVVRTASLITWLLYIVLAVGVGVAAPFLAEYWLSIKLMDNHTTTEFLRIVGISALLTLPRSLYASILRGVQRLDLSNLIDVVSLVVQQGGTVLVLVFGGGVYILAWWLAGSIAFHLLLYIVTAAHFIPISAFIPTYTDSIVSKNFPYASRTAMLSILGTLHMQADKALVSKLLPTAAFGPYAMATSLVFRLSLLANAVSQAALPSLSEAYAIGGRSALRDRQRQVHNLVSLTNVPVFAAPIFICLPLFSYLMTVQIAEVLLLPIVFLSIGSYMNGTITVPYLCSLAAGRPDIAMRFNFYALFIILPMSAVCISTLGLAGAGVGWVLYHVFAYIYFVPRVCTECLGVVPLRWYSHILKITSLATLLYGCSWAILHTSSNFSAPSIIITYLGSTMAFLVFAYMMQDTSLKQRIRIHLNYLFGRVSPI